MSAFFPSKWISTISGRNRTTQLSIELNWSDSAYVVRRTDHHPLLDSITATYIILHEYSNITIYSTTYCTSNTRSESNNEKATVTVVQCLVRMICFSPQTIHRPLKRSIDVISFLQALPPCRFISLLFKLSQRTIFVKWLPLLYLRTHHR